MRILGHPRKADQRRAQRRGASAKKPLDLAVYQHALATALIETGETTEAERLLVTVTEALRSPKFASLRDEAARQEAFEVYSSARGDVAAYVSLLNRAQLRLGVAVRDSAARSTRARTQYTRVLEGRSDDVTALAALARLAPNEAERARLYAEAFEANPFSMALIREYRKNPDRRRRRTCSARSCTSSAASSAPRARSSTRCWRSFPRTKRCARCAARRRRATRSRCRPPRRPRSELRALLDAFERLTPEQRAALDQATFTSVVDVRRRAGIDVRVRHDRRRPVPLLRADDLQRHVRHDRAADVPDPRRRRKRRAAARAARTGERAMKRLVFIALFALPTFAQVLTDTPRGVVVAHDRRIELADGWNVAGVEHATFITANDDRVAVLDALNNQAAIVDLATGRATRIRTAETPIAAIFVETRALHPRPRRARAAACRRRRHPARCRSVAPRAGERQASTSTRARPAFCRRSAAREYEVAAVRLRLRDRGRHGLPRLSARRDSIRTDRPAERDRKVRSRARSPSAPFPSISPSPAAAPRSPRASSPSPIRPPSASGSPSRRSRPRRPSRAASCAASSGSASSADARRSSPPASIAWRRAAGPGSPTTPAAARSTTSRAGRARSSRAGRRAARVRAHRERRRLVERYVGCRKAAADD